MPATESQLETPSTSRLVIRVKLIPQEERPSPARPRLSKGALLLVLGAGAVSLGWLALSTFRSDPVSAPSVSGEPLPKPTTQPTETMPVEPAVLSQADPPLSPVHEVIPDVPQSALQTITGTIRVSVRVIIDSQGAVVDATAQKRGPSRYFERLAVEAAKQWRFTPAQSEERRTMLVRFNFTRAGATASALER